jgi:predicted GH43/DUF377 family glycosyl hydrolase
MAEQVESIRRRFFGHGVFDWQKPVAPSDGERYESSKDYSFDLERWWGTFPRHEEPAVQARGDGDDLELFARFPWAIGPFRKHAGNPVLAPSPGQWDQGRFGGGVHNGSIVRHDERFYYVYRGERPIDVRLNSDIDYICDIGLAVSEDGVNFTKELKHGPFFRRGEFRRFSYEDVSLVRHDGTYYLFCNQWLWEDQQNTAINGTFLATSRDLRHWQRHGIVFPKAKRIHRNGVVVQDPRNNAVRVNGKFVMYINDGLIAYSEDLIHWESQEVEHFWGGGEGCVALANHDPARRDDLVLFTGGHHHGHFYAIGQVLFSHRDPAKALAYLPRPMLAADPTIPHETGYRAEPPHDLVSNFHDCIFFNALTQHAGKWWLYYGGSEYYTCLATAPASKE